MDYFGINRFILLIAHSWTRGFNVGVAAEVNVSNGVAPKVTLTCTLPAVEMALAIENATGDERREQ